MIYITNENTLQINNMAFESYVLNTLKSYLASQNKSIEIPKEIDIYDATLPNGIDELPGPLHVEIKFLSSNNSGYFRSIEQFANNAVNSSSGAILLIIGTKFGAIAKESIIKLVESRAKRKAYVWDIEDFELRTASTSDYASAPINILVDDAINKSSDEDSINIQQSQLSALKRKYQNEEVVLFLGAGVSIDAGIPLWDDLINRLFSEMILKKAKDKDISSEQLDKIIRIAYKNKEDSPLAQVRYIRSAFEKDEYNQLVHKVLYENKPKYKTRLLNTIAKICTPKRNHIGVQGVVTYNFDNLLEKRLDKLKVETNIIYSDQGISDPNKLSIFHVHGFLPNDLKDKDEVELIFSEEDYHKVYRDAYCWSNLVQLNYLRENTCLFIGCSLTDPNLRRLLDVAARSNEKPRHYAIMRKHQIVGSEEIDRDALALYKNIDSNLLEKYYGSLGINIIWVDEFAEIAKMLENLSE